MKLYHRDEEIEIISYSPDGKYAAIRWLRSGTLRTTATANIKEKLMSETNNVGEQNAADPAEDHKTPGGQSGDNKPSEPQTETTVETPGGTTVTESPAE